MRRTVIAVVIALGTASVIGSSAGLASASPARGYLGGAVYFSGYGQTAAAATTAAEDGAYNRGCRILYVEKPFRTTDPRGPWEDVVVGACP